MGTQNGLNVLVVDDEPDIRFLTKMILTQSGHKVVEASSGKECVEKIREDKPDVILMDVKLFDGDGWEVCRKIKEDLETRSISVVIFTCKSTKKDIERSFEYADADWHLTKPFKKGILTDILKCVDTDSSTIMEKINKVVEKGERRKEVLKMLNPKIMNYKYEFDSECRVLNEREIRYSKMFIVDRTAPAIMQLKRIRNKEVGRIMIGLGWIVMILSLITSNYYMHMFGISIGMIMLISGTSYLIEKNKNKEN